MMGRRSHAPAAPTLDAITPRVRSELRDGHGPAMASAGHVDRLEDRADVAEREGRSELHDPFVRYEAEVAIDGLAGPNHVHLAIAIHADFGERHVPDLARNVEEGHVAKTLTA